LATSLETINGRGAVRANGNLVSINGEKMAKSRDTRKEEKKKPTKTLMEKRADKKAKKASKRS
jgi:hypothetical protein